MGRWWVHWNQSESDTQAQAPPAAHHRGGDQRFRGPAVATRNRWALVRRLHTGFTLLHSHWVGFTDRPLNLSLCIFLGSYKQMHLNKLKKNYGSTGKINTSTIGGLDLAEVERGILIYNVAPLHKSYSTIKRNIILVYYPAIPVI